MRELTNEAVRAAIDDCLSGAGALPSVRANVLNELRGEVKVKKKFSVGVLVTALLTLMMMGAAVAAGLGLFGQMAGSNPDADSRLMELDTVSTCINRVFSLTEDTEPPVLLTVEQAYYDGTRVFISYTLTGPISKVQTYSGTPDAAEWDDVREDTVLAEMWGSEDPAVQAMFEYLDGTEPRWGRSAGYGVHDGLQLEDGTYLEIIGGDYRLLEDGSIVGWKECEVPAGAAADELNVQIGTFLRDTVYYQDGRTLRIDYRTNMRETNAWHTFTVTRAGQSQTLTGSVDAGEWSAVANMTLSAVDIKGEIVIKAPQTWLDFWLDWEYSGETPDYIHDWYVYEDGVKLDGHNLNGRVGSGGEGELVYYLCYQHVNPASEIVLVPRFSDSGVHLDEAIVLKIAE